MVQKSGGAIAGDYVCSDSLTTKIIQTESRDIKPLRDETHFLVTPQRELKRVLVFLFMALVPCRGFDNYDCRTFPHSFARLSLVCHYI